MLRILGYADHDLWVYDTNDFKWSKPEIVGAFPGPRQGHTATRHGKEIIVTGNALASVLSISRKVDARQFCLVTFLLLKSLAVRCLRVGSCRYA